MNHNHSGATAHPTASRWLSGHRNTGSPHNGTVALTQRNNNQSGGVRGTRRPPQVVARTSRPHLWLLASFPERTNDISTPNGFTNTASRIECPILVLLKFCSFATTIASAYLSPYCCGMTGTNLGPHRHVDRRVTVFRSSSCAYWQWSVRGSGRGEQCR